jgi:hypothetical protein
MWLHLSSGMSFVRREAPTRPMLSGPSPSGCRRWRVVRGGLRGCSGDRGHARWRRGSGPPRSSVNRRIAMIGGAIPTTGRRTIDPAWEFISLGTQPASLRCALPWLEGITRLEAMGPARGDGPARGSPHCHFTPPLSFRRRASLRGRAFSPPPLHSTSFLPSARQPAGRLVRSSRCAYSERRKATRSDFSCLVKPMWNRLS